MAQVSEVSQTIMRQLQALPVPGFMRGVNFFMLTGASKFVAIENGIQFKIAQRNKKHINSIVVKYDEGADLYNVEFWDCRLLKKDPYVINDMKSEITGLTWEDLPEKLANEVDLK